MNRSLNRPPSAESDLPVVIAGAGIGGLAAALALAQRGISVVVCERAPELTEVGAGLLLSPNAIEVLRLLGIDAEARAHSREIDEWRILDPRGRLLQRLQPTRSGGRAALSIHRGELQKLLLARLGALPNGATKHHVPRIQLGFEVTHFTTTPTSVTLHARSGNTVEGAALIGADGLRSAVRRTRDGDDALRDCGYSGWRGVVPFIPKGYEGRSLTESWGEGKRFGISPLAHGRCYWYATANVPTGHNTSPASRKQELLGLFSHWHSPIPELIAATENDQILLNRILDRPARFNMPGEPLVTLLGDAAHPMTPNLGQGACMALEDAWVLAREIATAPSIAHALNRYETARGSRAKWISRASNALGKIIQLEKPAAVALRDQVLRFTPGIVADITMRPLFSFRG